MFSIRVFTNLTFVLLFFTSCSNEPGIVEPTKNITTKSGVINDAIDGKPFVVFADEKKGIFTAFSSHLGSSKLMFEISDSPFPIKLRDSRGMEWDVFGNGASDSNKGEKLESVDFLTGYWFFFPSFFNHIELKDGRNLVTSVPEIQVESEWLIDKGGLQYGSFRDGIRSIDQPRYISSEGKSIVDNQFYANLNGEELVSVVPKAGRFKIYPHRILEFHEVINDFEEGSYSTISYCPLTGTSRIWDARIGGIVSEFGVSGILYNNNLVLYDRVSESHWSQILNISVQGNRIGEGVVSNDIFEMKYSEISKLEGEILLLDPKSGNYPSYASSQYADYLSNNHIFYPLATTDESIPPKERVIGITYKGITKVFRFSDFSQ